MRRGVVDMCTQFAHLCKSTETPLGRGQERKMCFEVVTPVVGEFVDFCCLILR